MDRWGGFCEWAIKMKLSWQWNYRTQKCKTLKGHFVILDILYFRYANKFQRNRSRLPSVNSNFFHPQHVIFQSVIKFLTAQFTSENTNVWLSWFFFEPLHAFVMGRLALNISAKNLHFHNVGLKYSFANLFQSVFHRLDKLERKCA